MTEESIHNNLPEDKEILFYLFIDEIKKNNKEIEGEYWFEFVLENSLVYFLDLRINYEFFESLRKLFWEKKIELSADFKNSRIKIRQIDLLLNKKNETLGGLTVYIKKL